jgi:hypothetical protein
MSTALTSHARARRYVALQKTDPAAIALAAGTIDSAPPDSLASRPPSVISMTGTPDIVYTWFGYFD